MILSGRRSECAGPGRGGRSRALARAAVRGHRASTRCPGVVERAWGWRGGVDLLVNNAGISQRSLALDTGLDVYRQLMEVDVLGPVALTQQVLPRMVARRSGHIAVVSSVAGKVGAPLRTGYCAAKHAVVGYFDALRCEVEKAYGIRVSVILPGPVRTAIAANALTADGSPRGRSDEFIENGMDPDAAARIMLDGLAAGQREIAVARGTRGDGAAVALQRPRSALGHAGRRRRAARRRAIRYRHDNLRGDTMNDSLIGRRAMLVFGAACTLSLAARAQPSQRLLTFVVPQPAGNPTDALVRKLQPALQKELGQAIVIDNTPGAGGSLGVRKALAAGGDGQVLLITSQTEPILTPIALASARYKPEDLRCVALAGSGPYLLVGRADLPATSHAELVASRQAFARAAAQLRAHRRRFDDPSDRRALEPQGRRAAQPRAVQGRAAGHPGPAGQADRSHVRSARRLDGRPGRVGQGPGLRQQRRDAVGEAAEGAAAVDARPRAVRTSCTPAGPPCSCRARRRSAAALRLHRALAAALADADVQAYMASTGGDRAAAMTPADLDRFYDGEIRLYQALAKEIGVTAQ